MFQVIYLVGVGPLGLAGLGAFTLVGNIVQFTDQADNIMTKTLYPGGVRGQATASGCYRRCSSSRTGCR